MTRQVLIYILYGALALAVVVAYFVFAFFPLSKQLGHKRQELAMQQQQLDHAHRILDHLDEYEAQALRLKQERARLEALVPDQPQTADLLKEVSRIATECNIKDFQFIPQKKLVQKEYIQQPVKVHVTCGYHTLGLFISHLAVLPRLVNAQEIQIKGKDKTGKTDSITAEMVLNIYERTH